MRWTSKYGSVVKVFYGGAAADGLNDKGLVANELYPAESDYGDPEKTGRPTLSVGGRVQHFADNFATVAEAVDTVKNDPLTLFSLFRGIDFFYQPCFLCTMIERNSCLIMFFAQYQIIDLHDKIQH